MHILLVAGRKEIGEFSGTQHGAGPQGVHCRTIPPRICPMGPMIAFILFEKQGPILDIAPVACVRWYHVCCYLGDTVRHYDPKGCHIRPTAYFPKPFYTCHPTCSFEGEP